MQGLLEDHQHTLSIPDSGTSDFSPLDSNSVRQWLLYASPAPAAVDSDSDPDYPPPKSLNNTACSSDDHSENTLRRSARLSANLENGAPTCSQTQNSATVNQENDPEYLPPKRVLNEIKKSNDDTAPQSDIITNVKRRTLRRCKKFFDVISYFRFDNEYFPLNSQEEQLFADIGMDKPLSTEQLMQLLEESASEEAAKKNCSVEESTEMASGPHNAKPKSKPSDKAEKVAENVENTSSNMNPSKPPLKLKLRKVNKKTVSSSPPKLKKESNSESDSGISQQYVTKDNSVLPKSKNIQKQKATRRKRQTCRKQFRHKDIPIFKLGSGQEKSPVPKNQAIQKIFSRRSSVGGSSPPLPIIDVDNLKDETSEQNVPLSDINSDDSNKKWDGNVSVKNVARGSASETKLNCEVGFAKEVPLSSTSSKLDVSKVERGVKQTKLNKSYKSSLRNKGESIPQLQIREEKSSNAPTSVRIAEQQMINRIDIGKHNLPIRIPERRSSIAEPLRTPPVLSKVSSLRVENELEHRTNYMKIEVKSGSSKESEVVYINSSGNADNASEIAKLKEFSPVVKLSRIPDSEILSIKQGYLGFTVDKQEKKKDVVEIKRLEKKIADNPPIEESIHKQLNIAQTETLTEVSQEANQISARYTPENLSIKVVKSRSGITDPLKLHKTHNLQTKKPDLNNKTRSSSATPPKDSNNEPNEIHDVSRNQPTFSSKKSPDLMEMGYKTSSILQQNLLMKPGCKLDPYRNTPTHKNNILVSNTGQETSPKLNSNSTGNFTNAASHVSKSMPIIEDASQQESLTSQLVNDTVAMSVTEVSKKYSRNKRTVLTPERYDYEDPASKLYRGNSYHSFNSYNYPFSLYARAHSNSPYSTVPSFPLNIPPYNMGPPIFQPKPRQPSPSNVKFDEAVFQNTASRSPLNPFMPQESRLPLHPGPLANVPSSEAYNSQMNYDQLIRFGNAIFTNRSPMTDDYNTAASTNRRNEVLRQSSNATTQQRSFSTSPTSLFKTVGRQNIYKPFPVHAGAEIHQKCSKLSESRDSPLALTKNATSHCNERNIPLFSRNEELTITKLPLKESSLNSAGTLTSYGANPKPSETNSITLSRLAEHQQTDKFHSESSDERSNLITKLSINDTEVIGPLRLSSSKTEILKPAYTSPQNCVKTKTQQAELASISVSTVKNNEKQKLFSAPTKQEVTSHVNKIFSEQLKMLNLQAHDLFSEKSYSKLSSDVKTVLPSAYFPCGPNAPLPTATLPPSTSPFGKVRKNIDEFDIKTKISPHCTISDSSPSDTEKEPKAERKESTSTSPLAGIKDATIPLGNEPKEGVVQTESSIDLSSMDTSNLSEASRTENKLSDMLQRLANSDSSSVSAITAITFVIHQMLEEADKMPEERKSFLHSILEGATKHSKKSTKTTDSLIATTIKKETVDCIVISDDEDTAEEEQVTLDQSIDQNEQTAKNEITEYNLLNGQNANADKPSSDPPLGLDKNSSLSNQKTDEMEIAERSREKRLPSSDAAQQNQKANEEHPDAGAINTTLQGNNFTRLNSSPKFQSYENKEQNTNLSPECTVPNSNSAKHNTGILQLSSKHEDELNSVKEISEDNAGVDRSGNTEENSLKDKKEPDFEVDETEPLGRKEPVSKSNDFNNSPADQSVRSVEYDSNCVLDLSAEGTRKSYKEDALPELQPHLVQSSLTGSANDKSDAEEQSNNTRLSPLSENTLDSDNSALNFSAETSDRGTCLPEVAKVLSEISKNTPNNSQSKRIRSPLNNKNSTYDGGKNLAKANIQRNVIVKTPLSSPCSVIQMSPRSVSVSPSNVEVKECVDTMTSNIISAIKATSEIFNFDRKISSSKILFSADKQPEGLILQAVEEKSPDSRSEISSPIRSNDKYSNSEKDNISSLNQNSPTENPETTDADSVIMPCKLSNRSNLKTYRKSDKSAENSQSGTPELQESQTSPSLTPVFTGCTGNSNLSTDALNTISSTGSNDKNIILNNNDSTSNFNLEPTNNKTQENLIVLPNLARHCHGSNDSKTKSSPVPVIECYNSRGDNFMLQNKWPQHLNSTEDEKVTSPKLNTNSDKGLLRDKQKITNNLSTNANKKLENESIRRRSIDALQHQGWMQQATSVSLPVTNILSYSTATTRIQQSYLSPTSITNPGEHTKTIVDSNFNNSYLMHNELASQKSATIEDTFLKRNVESTAQRTHHTLASTKLKYRNQEGGESGENNTLMDLGSQNSEKIGDKRKHVSSETPSKRRYADLYENQVDNSERLAGYHQSHTQYHPESYRMYATRPSENNPYRPSGQSQQSAEEAVNFTKPSPVLSTKAYLKPINPDHSVEVPGRGVDMRTHPLSRQPSVYSPVDSMNQTKYASKDSFGAVASYSQNNTRQVIASSGMPSPLSDAQHTRTPLNAHLMADLKEKCLRSSRNFHPGVSETTFSNVVHQKTPKENQTNLRLNANPHNLGSNTSPEYGYFSPPSRNTSTHYDSIMHHPSTVRYNEHQLNRNVDYRRMPASSMLPATETRDKYRTDAALNDSSSSSSSYSQQNQKVTNSRYQDPTVISRNRTVHDQIKSILPNLQHNGTLTPEQYVREMEMLGKAKLHRDFVDFYTFVTKKQIAGNQAPISFRIFLEFQNAGKLKVYEEAFKVYSEKHEKEKKITPKSN